jgi:hypothetical protein
MRAYGRKGQPIPETSTPSVLNHAGRIDVLRRALDNPDLPARRAFLSDADVLADDAAEHEGSGGAEDSQGSTGNVTIS